MSLEIPASHYLNPLPGGRVYTLAEARGVALRGGDTIVIRDLSQVTPPEAYSLTARRGRWHLRPYRLATGESGRLLMVNDLAREQGEAAVPPEIAITIDLPGWYAIWLGVPRLDLRPILSWGLDGVDVALDGEPGFVHIQPERGTRKGRQMGPLGVEVMCYWKCAQLDGRKLHLRIPYGCHASQPWGLVRGSLSAIKLVRLSDEQAAAYQRDTGNAATKRVIYVNDGFTHYWLGGVPGAGIDARFVQTYRDSDVKIIILQTPATGVANWPSRVTCLVGEAVPDEKWKLLRRGDRRAYDYLRWACQHGQEGMKVMSELCHRAGMQFHAGMRMNLFFTNGPLGNAVEEYLNGFFWRDHPELRKPDKVQGHNGLAGSAQWDYALPLARQFVIDVLVELATKYELDGVNLDFTRWPPVADPERHDFTVLTGFIEQIRQALDLVAATKQRPIALSASVVDGYHAFATLAEQKIDLEAWLASGVLDFICVQAWDPTPYLELARRYHTPCYAIMDQESIDEPRGKRFDPAWQQDQRQDEDPVPGEELEDAPHVNSSLDPTEYDRGALRYYRMGVDGVALVNAWGSYGWRLGHVTEMAQRVQTGEIFGQDYGPTITVH